MKTLRRYILLALATPLLILGGCINDDFKARTGETVLVMTVSMGDTGTASRDFSGRPYSDAPTRGAFDQWGDNENDKWGIEGENISQLRIIIINGEGSVEVNSLFTGENVTKMGQYEFKISDNDTKTVILIGNEGDYALDEEGMEISNGTKNLSQYLKSLEPGASVSLDEIKRLTVSLNQHNAIDVNNNLSFKKPLLISAIYTEEIPDADEQETIEREYWMHRAAVKYSFRIVNDANVQHKLNAVRINRIANREYLLPDADYTTNSLGHQFVIEDYRTPTTAQESEYAYTLQTPLTLNPKMTEAVEAIPAFYVPEGLKSDEVQKVSLKIDGVDLDMWRDLEWQLPGQSGTSTTPMMDLPRNTHVVVNITIHDNDIRLVACVQPFAEQVVNPWFGLPRDPDGNVIIKTYPDGTYDVIDPNKNGDVTMKDADGDEVEKKFSDGSYLCKTTVLKDYIHDSNEVDYTYVFEKDYSGGNMIIIREKSAGGTFHGDVAIDGHDHSPDDKALFVLDKKGDFYRVTGWVNDPETNTPRPILNAHDVDGAKIIQVNGFQFRAIIGMRRYIGTYVVQPYSDELVMDKDGNPVLDDNGKPMYKLLTDENGDPVYQLRWFKEDYSATGTKREVLWDDTGQDGVKWDDNMTSAEVKWKNGSYSVYSRPSKNVNNSRRASLRMMRKANPYRR